MAARARRIGFALLGVSLVVLLAGCPKPALTVNGLYEGQWTGEVLGQDVTCDLTMDLNQVAMVALGTVEFSYACFLPGDLISGVGLDRFTIPLVGDIDNEGTIHLEFDPTAITGDLGFSVVIAYDGVAVDTDEDGVVDEITGMFTFTWTIQTQIEGYEEFEIAFTGTFDVASAAD